MNDSSEEEQTSPEESESSDREERDGQPRESHDPYEALRLRDYRLYVFGWMMAAIGAQIKGVGVGWEIYERTGDVLSLGIAGGVQAIPLMLLALPAGHLADMFSRKKIIILSLVLQVMCSAGLVAFSYFEGPIPLMYGLLFLGSMVMTLGRPARSALVPLLVPAETFSNAAMWNSSTFQLASMVGPALGGLVVAFSIPLAYLLDIVGAFIFFVCLICLKVPRPDGPRERMNLESLLAGVRYVRRVDVILAAITLDLFAVLFGGATYLLPVFAKDILYVGAAGFGWLRAAPGIGAFAMALILAHLPPMRKAGKTLLLSVAGFGVATIVFGLSKSFWLSMAMLFVTGALDNVSVVVRHTLVQMLTPDHMRGRVSGVNSIFIGASNELGGLESGVTAALVGPVLSVVLGGLGTLAVVFGAAKWWPSLREFGSLLDARPMEE